MLRLLTGRVAKIGAQDRITLHCADARDFTPTGSPCATYDLVVTHFFLDCLTTAEVQALAASIRNHLRPGARWIVSEFAIPRGPLSIPATLVVRSLYAAFRFLTRLKARRLPDHASAFRACGLTLVNRRRWLGGLLVSEIWEAQATAGADIPSIR